MYYGAIHLTPTLGGGAWWMSVPCWGISPQAITRLEGERSAVISNEGGFGWRIASESGIYSLVLGAANLKPSLSIEGLPTRLSRASG